MKLHDIARLIFEELSGERAQAITTEITKYHRPPGSEGYHAATNVVARELSMLGLENITSARYPLDAETSVGHHPLPLAWEPYGAVVCTVSPVEEEVVNMESASSCLAWWSAPTPNGGITAELVDVGTGESDRDFRGKDVRGKIVLIGHTERPGGWVYAAREALNRGAVGILSDYLFYTFKPYRTRENLPEAVQLLRLPNQQGDYNAWACSISYTAAQRLRSLLQQGPVKLHAEIRARLFKGEGENLVATIPGRELSDEFVLFVAHTSAATCPCANCAAGPALMVEIARTLNKLIERGEIERPRRSIKFLFVIEGSGSKAYIASNRDEISKIKTVFCFDSVGHDQSKLKSSLLFYNHPDSTPSFINDYFAGVMERVPKDNSWVFRESKDLSPVRFYQAPYTPWSDNHIWAGLGIPSPLIMSWPDLYFHTQFLTADKTDPQVFRMAGVTSALAAYEIANANADEAMIIAQEVFARGRYRLEETFTRRTRQLLENKKLGCSESTLSELTKRTVRELQYFGKRDAEAIMSVLQLIPPEQQGKVIEQLKHKADSLSEYAMQLSAQLGPIKVNEEQSHSLLRTPHRTKPGIISALGYLSYHELISVYEELVSQDPTVIFDTLRPIGDEIWNLIDGRRSLRDIAEALCVQFGLSVKFESFLPLVKGLEQAGLITFDEPVAIGKE